MQILLYGPITYPWLLEWREIRTGHEEFLKATEFQYADLGGKLGGGIGKEKKPEANFKELKKKDDDDKDVLSTSLTQ